MTPSTPQDDSLQEVGPRVGPRVDHLVGGGPCNGFYNLPMWFRYHFEFHRGLPTGLSRKHRGTGFVQSTGVD